MSSDEKESFYSVDYDGLSDKKRRRYIADTDAILEAGDDLVRYNHDQDTPEDIRKIRKKVVLFKAMVDCDVCIFFAYRFVFYAVLNVCVLLLCVVHCALCYCVSYVQVRLWDSGESMDEKRACVYVGIMQMVRNPHSGYPLQREKILPLVRAMLERMEISATNLSQLESTRSTLIQCYDDFHRKYFDAMTSEKMTAIEHGARLLGLRHMILGVSRLMNMEWLARKQQTGTGASKIQEETKTPQVILEPYETPERYVMLLGFAWSSRCIITTCFLTVYLCLLHKSLPTRC